MSDKELRSMNKIQLLNIMREQELEIERLTAKIEEMAAEKDKLAKSAEERRASFESEGRFAEASLAASAGIWTEYADFINDAHAYLHDLLKKYGAVALAQAEEAQKNNSGE